MFPNFFRKSYVSRNVVIAGRMSSNGGDDAFNFKEGVIKKILEWSIYQK